MELSSRVGSETKLGSQFDNDKALVSGFGIFLSGKSEGAIPPNTACSGRVGTRRAFGAFFWLRVFSTSQAESHPTHPSLTLTVGHLIFNRNTRKHMWDYSRIEKLIAEGVEESLLMEYKSADALSKSDSKKREITKDVSAMANSASGVIIYGIKEYDENDKRHLPEKIDGVDRTEYSKEWLEQVINNIRPKIDGLLITPISIPSDRNQGIYIVEIPQSTTAHQATDYRYYKRHNFESVPMEDYEVKDVIHRVTTSLADVHFDFKIIQRNRDYHEYALVILLRNLGVQVIKNFKLIFSFPDLFKSTRNVIHARQNATLSTDTNGNFRISYRSKEVIFPEDEIDINEDIAWCYTIDSESYHRIRDAKANGEDPKIEWVLYADDMSPKRGSKSISEFYDY